MIITRSQRNNLVLCLAFFLFSACKHDKIYRAQQFNIKVNLNDFPKSSKPIFSQRHLKSKKKKWVGGLFGSSQFEEWNEVLYKDTVIRINPQVEAPFDAKSSAYPSDERVQFDFQNVTFINPAKTSFIASICGPYSLGTRYYIFTAQKSGLKVYSINRPTVIAGDREWENREMTRISPDLLLVDNDYIFNCKAGSSFEITRQGKDRIHGDFAGLSPDQQTIAFTTTDNLLYQCHYPSGAVYSEPIGNEELSKIAKDTRKEWPYNYFSWVTDTNGRMFLKSAAVSKHLTK